MNALTRLGLASALLLLHAAPVLAFTDPQLFEEPPEQGGGGGRQFTGSPEDGYACSSCHRGAAAPKLDIRGLPELFRPGQLYEVRLRWDGKAAPHSLHLELVTDQGEHPDVSIEPDAVVPPEGRCDNDPQGDAANYSVDIERRRVVGVRDCGASELAVQFVAPDRPKLYFAASIVRSDRSSNPKGDGVLDVRRVLARMAEPSGAGCGISTRGGHAWVWLLLLFALPRISRPNRRRTSAILPAVSALVCSSACYQAEHSVEAPSEPTALGVGIPWQSTQNTGSASPDANPGTLALTLRVTTSPVGGQFAPSNVGAIWVETAEGSFVKTLARWGRSRAIYLRKFQAASKGNLVDAITSATLSEHQAHEITWNLQGLDQNVIPDGAYRLLVEMTDKNATGALTIVPFTKDALPSVTTPPDTAQFHMMELVLDFL